MELNFSRIFFLIFFTGAIIVVTYWHYDYFYAIDPVNRGPYLAFMQDSVVRDYQRLQSVPGVIQEWVYRRWMTPKRIINDLEFRLEEHFAIEERYPININEIDDFTRFPALIKIIYRRPAANQYYLKVVDQQTGEVFEKTRQHEY